MTGFQEEDEALVPFRTRILVPRAMTIQQKKMDEDERRKREWKKKEHILKGKWTNESRPLLARKMEGNQSEPADKLKWYTYLFDQQLYMETVTKRKEEEMQNKEHNIDLMK